MRAFLIIASGTPLLVSGFAAMILSSRLWIWFRIFRQRLLMKFIWLVALFLLTPVISSATASAQRKNIPDPNRVPPVVRTTMRHEQRHFAYGGTLTIVGAPEGSITIEAWPETEVDISAEIQLRADSESDLDLLAAVNTFTLDEDANHLRIITTGTHDKAFMRSVQKRFPKQFPRTLMGLPFKIDYRIRVPIATDIEVNAGRGPINLAGIEGNIQVSAAESDAKLNLSGGTLIATIGTGTTTLTVPSRSWRGVGADIRMAAGEINAIFSPGFSGDVDAEILRTGQIVDSYGELRVSQKPALPQKVKARAGSGGASFRFTIGDGTINIKKAVSATE
jgi:hypothetical protein